MKNLIYKTVMYFFVILLALEVLIRVFYLTKDYPNRIIDEYGVERWASNQNGFGVTGNRRQNFSEYRINNSGYNSYREFKPSSNKLEVAIVGDSFIEGFHQDYYNSIGKKIEEKLNNIEVYEYGYAGYDLADQLHLISKYKKDFDLIDYVVIGVKFENDLKRSHYKIAKNRMKLESPLFKNLRKIKILSYFQGIGIMDIVINKKKDLVSFFSKTNIEGIVDSDEEIKDSSILYMENFKTLISIYGFDKKRFLFLLDEEKTPTVFINYLKNKNFKYIDFSKSLSSSKLPTTLIYDKHWNNHGRDLIANKIAAEVKFLMNRKEID